MCIVGAVPYPKAAFDVCSLLTATSLGLPLVAAISISKGWITRVLSDIVKCNM